MPIYLNPIQLNSDIMNKKNKKWKIKSWAIHCIWFLCTVKSLLQHNLEHLQFHSWKCLLNLNPYNKLHVPSSQHLSLFSSIEILLVTFSFDFLSTEESDFDYMLFSDSLVTTSDAGKEVGEFSVQVEPAHFHGQDCFLIHANSHGIVDNVPCGTSITSYVSKRLETLEQQHHEYVKVIN